MSVLRDWINGPLTDPFEISKRHDAVQYFKENHEAFQSCRECLKGLPDLELAMMAVLNLKIRLKDFRRAVVTIDNVSKALSKVWNLDAAGKVPLLIEEIVSVIVKSFGHNKAILSQINIKLPTDGAAEREDHLNVLRSWKQYDQVCARQEEVSLLEDGLEKHKKSICRSLGWLMFRYTSVADQDYLIEVKLKDSTDDKFCLILD